MNKPFRLESRRDIFRTLWWRLLLVGAVMSMVVGVISFRTMTADFVDRIHDVALIKADFFNRQLLPLFSVVENPTAQQLASELQRFSAAGQNDSDKGRFVLVNFYDKQGKRLLEVAHGELSDIDNLRRKLVQIPVLEKELVRAEEIAGKSYVLAVFPLRDNHGDKRLYLLGLFEPSPQAVAVLELRIIRNSLLVAAIVLLTTLLLYPLLISLFGRVQDLSARLLQSNLETLMVLGSAIAKRDSDTDIHNFRVTVYAVSLAQEVGLKFEEIQALIKGAFLHDVGKIGIHDHILLKPGPLDDNEFAEMKRHVEYGEDIVSRSVWLEDALPVVRCHHEKIDGSGYMQGLQGDEIPIIARIFTIVDVFDALTVRRPYKKPFPLNEAMAIMREGAGQHFDRELIGLFEVIAEDLHRRFATVDSEQMHQHLEEIVVRYFNLEKT